MKHLVYQVTDSISDGLLTLNTKFWLSNPNYFKYSNNLGFEHLGKIYPILLCDTMPQLS